MREILFRAKGYDGWKEGDLIHEPFATCIQSVKNGSRIKSKVDSKTVCQYISLNDKNGKKIFEGDIVCGLFADEKITGYIKYGSNAHFYIERNGLYGIHLDNAQDWLEIIGNIFDNPELLK